MIKNILILLLILAVIIFVFSLFVGNNLDEIRERKDDYQNPVTQIIAYISTSSDATDENSYTLFDLPFIRSATPTGEEREPTHAEVEAELLRLEREYDDLQEELEEARTFGNPSPHVGSVTLTGPWYSSFVNTDEPDNPREEYLTLTASYANTAPINLTGWSLQSLLSGVRVYIPQGARILRAGTAGSLGAVQLDPGASAVVTSGPSPVGVSFRTNTCTGYLEQFQDFEPTLSKECPTPREELPDTVDNIIAYGETCIDFVRNLPQCEYFLGTFPSNITPACRAFVQNELTYNSCVERHSWRGSFLIDRPWRIFLNSPVELWRDTRDVIRLLDAEGRTVDVWSY